MMESPPRRLFPQYSAAALQIGTLSMPSLASGDLAATTLASAPLSAAAAFVVTVAALTAAVILGGWVWYVTLCVTGAAPYSKPASASPAPSPFGIAVSSAVASPTPTPLASGFEAPPSFHAIVPGESSRRLTAGAAGGASTPTKRPRVATPPASRASALAVSVPGGGVPAAAQPHSPTPTASPVTHDALLLGSPKSRAANQMTAGMPASATRPLRAVGSWNLLLRKGLPVGLAAAPADPTGDASARSAPQLRRNATDGSIQHQQTHVDVAPAVKPLPPQLHVGNAPTPKAPAPSPRMSDPGQSSLQRAAAAVSIASPRTAAPLSLVFGAALQKQQQERRAALHPTPAPAATNGTGRGASFTRTELPAQAAVSQQQPAPEAAVSALFAPHVAAEAKSGRKDPFPDAAKQAPGPFSGYSKPPLRAPSQAQSSSSSLSQEASGVDDVPGAVNRDDETQAALIAGTPALAAIVRPLSLGRALAHQPSGVAPAVQDVRPGSSASSESPELTENEQRAAHFASFGFATHRTDAALATGRSAAPQTARQAVAVQPSSRVAPAPATSRSTFAKPPTSRLAPPPPSPSADEETWALQGSDDDGGGAAAVHLPSSSGLAVQAGVRPLRHSPAAPSLRTSPLAAQRSSRSPPPRSSRSPPLRALPSPAAASPRAAEQEEVQQQGGDSRHAFSRTLRFPPSGGLVPTHSQQQVLLQQPQRPRQQQPQQAQPQRTPRIAVPLPSAKLGSDDFDFTPMYPQPSPRQQQQQPAYTARQPGSPRSGAVHIPSVRELLETEMLPPSPRRSRQQAPAAALPFLREALQQVPPPPPLASAADRRLALALAAAQAILREPPPDTEERRPPASLAASRSSRELPLEGRRLGPPGGLAAAGAHFSSSFRARPLHAGPGAGLASGPLSARSIDATAAAADVISSGVSTRWGYASARALPVDAAAEQRISPPGTSRRWPPAAPLLSPGGSLVAPASEQQHWQRGADGRFLF
jgi:hypothetical protein